MKRGTGLLVLGAYIISTAFFCGKIPAEKESVSFGAAELGAACIANAYPGIQIELNKGEIEKSDAKENLLAAECKESRQKSEAVLAVPTENEKKQEPVLFGDEPVVLIVHTHATESYLPSSSGNYHKKGNENTVRDVGDVLAKTLEKQGIAVVHDKTLHDVPSYNQSYSRSYETIEEMIKKYPSICSVIDLHRDAIASEAYAATISVDGRKCAPYSYVVSDAVETSEANMKFIENMNKTADKSFKGFRGKVLERGYRYNQNLSSKYMLLEIGYNRNDIEEARNTAEIFGKILAQTLKAGY